MATVGAAVRKRFGRRFFAGTVTSHDAEAGFFHVKYEDSDSEDMDEEELLPLLVAPPEAGKAPRTEKHAAAPKMPATRLGRRAARQSPPNAAASRKRRARSEEASSGEESGSDGSGSSDDDGREAAEAAAPWDEGGTESEAAATSSSSDEAEPPPPPPPKPVKSVPAAVAAPKPPKPRAKPQAKPPAAVAPPLPACADEGGPSEPAKPKGRTGKKKQPGMAPLPEGPAAAAAVRACLAEYTRLFLLAKRSEDERFAAAGGRRPDGKAMSKRPDLKALSALQTANRALNQKPVLGPVPGIPIGARFYGRAEICAVGLHGHWLSGIAYIGAKEAPSYGHPIPMATSIIVSGGYEDDEDDGDTLVYTGQGGNDLLGNQRQTADQKWERGNQALAGSCQLGLPVRVVRANPDKEAMYGKVFIYDGLYDVLAADETTGISGCGLCEGPLCAGKGATSKPVARGPTARRD